jgi:hypothetical protein
VRENRAHTNTYTVETYPNLFPAVLVLNYPCGRLNIVILPLAFWCPTLSLIPSAAGTGTVAVTVARGKDASPTFLSCGALVLLSSLITMLAVTVLGNGPTTATGLATATVRVTATGGSGRAAAIGTGTRAGRGARQAGATLAGTARRARATRTAAVATAAAAGGAEGMKVMKPRRPQRRRGR